ncbi:MAG: EVE domain-containing protein, partial [Bacteroidia bacterium]|nr:EVE domain-containing protein [Bacteroidia bacterium]
VSREAFPEPGDSRYVVVELIPIRKLLRCIPLIEIKAEPSFSHIELVRQPRLSVMPISSELWRWIMDRETV